MCEEQYKFWVRWYWKSALQLLHENTGEEKPAPSLFVASTDIWYLDSQAEMHSTIHVDNRMRSAGRCCMDTCGKFHVHPLWFHACKYLCYLLNMIAWWARPKVLSFLAHVQYAMLCTYSKRPHASQPCMDTRPPVDVDGLQTCCPYSPEKCNLDVV